MPRALSGQEPAEHGVVIEGAGEHLSGLGHISTLGHLYLKTSHAHHPPKSVRLSPACLKLAARPRVTQSTERAGTSVRQEMPGPVIRIRDREAGDVGLCVQVLAEVHQTSGYPTNWPADPAQWLTPPGIVRAWVVRAHELPIAGHVVLRQVADSPAGPRVAEVSRLFVAPAARRQGVAQALLQQAMHWAEENEQNLVLEVTDHLQAARALYERAGFRRSGTKLADWTAPGGLPVILHQYRWSGLPEERSGG